MPRLAPAVSAVQVTASRLALLLAAPPPLSCRFTLDTSPLLAAPCRAVTLVPHTADPGTCHEVGGATWRVMVVTCPRVQVRVQASAAGGVTAWSPPTAVLGRPAPPTLASIHPAAPTGEGARAEVTVSGAASAGCEVAVEAAGGEVELYSGPGPACPRPSGGCCPLARLHTRLQVTLPTCTTFTLRARCSNYLNLSQVYWPVTFGKYFFRGKIFSPLQELEAALLPQLGNLSQLELVRDSAGRWRLDSEWSDPVLHQTPCKDGGRGEAVILSSWSPVLQCQYIQHFRQRSLGWRHHLRGGQYSSPLTRTLYFR